MKNTALMPCYTLEPFLERIKDVKISSLNLPLKETFRTSLGEKNITHNVGVVIECETVKGYGEASSSLAIPEATQASMMSIIAHAAQILIGTDPEDWEGLCHEITSRYPEHTIAISALECALLDVFCRLKKCSIASYFGNKKKKIETYYTIAALEPSQSMKIAKTMIKNGFKKFKVKVTGKDLGEDIQRIEKVYSSGKNISLIIDANQGLDRQSAMWLIESLQKLSIKVDLLEQPLSKLDIDGHKFIKNHSPIPIALDESINTVQDAKDFLKSGAADIINLKIARTGLLEGLRIAALVKKMRKKLMIGCMMESAAGLSTSIQWALGSGAFSYHDLDSFLLLKDTPQDVGFTNQGSILVNKNGIHGSGTLIS